MGWISPVTLVRSTYERFIDKVVLIPFHTCWEWNAAKTKQGYGSLGIGLRSQTMLAHRFSYIHHKGIVSDGMCVLHKCDNPSCVNPEHLFLGTNQDNVNDKMSKKRHQHSYTTHCRNGHEFTEANTYTDSRGSRVCRPCHLVWKRKWRSNQ